ncbi:ATP-grasp fold amidoligase family protein [Burkholderia sp. WSM2230]|uniref:ATP-grasp fold amidoligase family protein n=1 Tax=Burkholderia sp. WSM2230 TaxID=944435 RepID=UPI0004242722|nr:ATP-grasp fold amidoligase family protein [Burkholderia sp. WSM2230]
MTTTNSVQFPGEAGTSVPQLQTQLAESTAPARRQSTLRKVKEAAKSLLPAPLFLTLLHHKEIGRYPNLFRPTTFNEKILQKSLRPDPWFAELTDKLTVRAYVARKLGEQHVIPLLAAPDVFTREVFDALPDSFVMKANHGSSYVEVVRDKSARSFEQLRELADYWLTLDFYKIAREKHYRQIKPRIFFEKLLLDNSGQIPADYKLHCFGGRSGRPLIYILVISDRFGTNTRGDIYDASWNHLDMAIGAYKPSPKPAPRPENLDLILAAARKLSEDFDYVRVDLYAPDNQIYFGELTFTPGAGVLPFTPDKVDYEWGKLVPDAFLSARPPLPTPVRSTA